MMPQQQPAQQQASEAFGLFDGSAGRFFSEWTAIVFSETFWDEAWADFSVMANIAVSSYFAVCAGKAPGTSRGPFPTDWTPISRNPLAVDLPRAWPPVGGDPNEKLNPLSDRLRPGSGRFLL